MSWFLPADLWMEIRLEPALSTPQMRLIPATTCRY
jgi:hypothetical protein